MNKITAALLAAAAALSVSLPATAGTILKPTGATASSSHSSGYLPTNTINGSGLPTPTSIGSPHAAYAAGNHWTAASGDLTNAWIQWSFSTPQTIGAAYIWNHRSDGVANHGGYDVTLFDLTFYDSLGNVLLFMNNQSLGVDNPNAQRIDFALLSDVAAVRFDVEGVQNPLNWTGLAEVAFDTESYFVAPVPEPGTWAMMIGGFGLMGGLMRRRKTQDGLARTAIA